MSCLNGAIWTTEQARRNKGKQSRRNKGEQSNLRAEAPLHGKSSHRPMLAGFSPQFKVPPYFFNGAVTGEEYCSMFTSHCIPLLTSRRALSRTTFQQDGAAPTSLLLLSSF